MGGPEQASAHDARQRATRSVVRGRLVVAPLFLALSFLQPGVAPGSLLVLCAVALLWVGATSWVVLRGHERRPAVGLIIAGDIAVLGVATLITMGPRSHYAFVALLALSMTPPVLGRRERLALYGLFAVCVGGPVLAQDLGTAGRPETALAFVGALAIAYVLATRRARVERGHARRLRGLLEEREELLSRSSVLAEDERRRVSQRLHDEVLQTLLAAGQDLDEAARATPSDDVAAARASLRSSVDALRATVGALHPASLAGGRLPDELQAIGEQHRRRGDRVRTSLDPLASGPHDEALLAVGRELIADAVASAAGGEVQVTLTHGGHQLMLDVAVPGRPHEPEVEEGVGVAWAAARLRAIGGGVERRHALGAAPGRRAWAPAVEPQDGEEVLAAVGSPRWG